MKISFLGGAGEVGASCILVNIDNKNILMDSGIRQGSGKDPLPNLRSLQEEGGVDAIIISHAHMDHIGALPLISKEYPNAKIYMNNVTKDIVRVLLYDSIKIMNNREAEIPLYAEADVVNMLDRIYTINYLKEKEIFEGIKISFYLAGHVVGASCIYITSDEGSLFYSGDFSVFSQKSIEGVKVPKLRPDMAIFEATYGDKLHSNRDLEEEKLIALANECVLNSGKMIIPAFALGRAQEVILILKSAMNKGKIKKVNIFIDGMVKEINRVYKQNPLFLKSSLGKKILRGTEPFYDDYIKPVENSQQREEIINSKDSAIIISSSGMLTGGPSQSYAEKIAAMENGYIVITGYQDEEAPGRKLLNLLEDKPNERIIELNGKLIPVKCVIKRVGLSAHSDKSEIKALISILNPKNIALVHGEEGIIGNLASELTIETRARIYAPKLGESIFLDIKNPRKQLKRQYSVTLNKKEVLNEDNLKELWEFVLENYSSRLFTIEELLILWHGYKNNISQDVNMQSLFFNSLYFENDNRIFFMFRARSKEAVEEDLRPKDLKANEVSLLATQYFEKYNIKKAGLKQDKKILILHFDFPKALSYEITGDIHSFELQSGWKIEINEATNHTAAEAFVRSMLKNTNIKKISYYISENVYEVSVDEEIKDFLDVAVEFERITGFKLRLKEAADKLEIDTDVYKAIASEVLEQNQALKYVDDFFKDAEFKPYKKSIKPDKLIELTFISPEIGIRNEKIIKELAQYTGWNFKISKTVNQIDIIALAVNLCKEEGIFIKKNPSFNCESNKVTIKIDPSSVNNEILYKIKTTFEYRSGCSFTWV
jgi:predicted metal-dependent RNase